MPNPFYQIKSTQKKKKNIYICIYGQFSRIWYKSRKLRFLPYTGAQRLVSLCLWYCADAARTELQVEPYFYMSVLNVIDFRGQKLCFLIIILKKKKKMPPISFFKFFLAKLFTKRSLQELEYPSTSHLFYSHHFQIYSTCPKSKENDCVIIV